MRSASVTPISGATTSSTPIAASWNTVPLRSRSDTSSSTRTPDLDLHRRAVDVAVLVDLAVGLTLEEHRLGALRRLHRPLDGPPLAGPGDLVTLPDLAGWQGRRLDRRQV